MPFAATFSLSSLTAQTGQQITGLAAGDQLGTDLALADVNGDGFIDLILGAQGAGSFSGAGYVVFGDAGGLPDAIDLSALNGTNGYTFTGSPSTRMGTTLSTGDLNNDGILDLVIGGSSSGGRVSIIFGQESAGPAIIAYDDLDGDIGSNFTANEMGVGYSVQATGDINGDGIDDLIVGGTNGNGVTYVLFGKASGWTANSNLSDVDGTDGFRITGVANYSIGQSLTCIDLNQDGIDDLVIGSATADFAGPNSGGVYVIFGKAAGWAATDTITNLADITLSVAGTDLLIGNDVTNLGDVNGDGLDDLGVSGSGSSTGYVVYGKTTPWADALDLAALDGTDGFKLVSTVNLSQISSVGDVNNDGFLDLAVGGVGISSTLGGAHILFGKAGGWDASESLSGLDGVRGFTIVGEASSDLTGRAVTGGVDVNGDGIDDIVLTALGNDAGGNIAGAAFIVYGQQGAINRIGTAVGETLIGNIAGDTLSGLDGADILQGLAGDDELLGGAGGDVLDGGLGADEMVGGTGDDTYLVDDLGDVVTELGGEGSDRVRSSITFSLGAEVENLNLEGSADIDATGNALANQINGNSGANVLVGDAGNDIVRGFDGLDELNGGDGNDQLIGGNGNDELQGGADNDILQGNADDDTLFGGTGIDSLDGGTGLDILDGEAGNDRLFGGDGDDQLFGGADNDALTGGAGSDTLSGGTGDDTYFVDDYSDTLVEAVGEGSDVVKASVSWTLGADFERLILGGLADLNGTGNELANQITGNGGANILDGGEGSDILNGGLGNDTLIGGLGTDILVGGGGNDTFLIRQESVFTSGDPGLRSIENDSISDYVVGQDIIDLSDIDAIDATSAVNDAFSIVGAFNGNAGQMTVNFAGGVTTVLLDVDGDQVADYRLRINGNAAGDTGAWIL